MSEARRGTALFGDEAILRTIVQTERSADADTLARRKEDAALSFCAGTPTDDIAILVLRLPGDPG